MPLFYIKQFIGTIEIIPYPYPLRKTYWLVKTVLLLVLWKLYPCRQVCAAAQVTATRSFGDA